MKTQIHSILIPTDFSDLSESALKVAIAIAKRQDAQLTLLHVMSYFSFIQPTEVFLPDFKIIPDLKFDIEQKFDALSKEIQNKTNVKVVWKVLHGSVSEIICQFAHEEKIDLIVMGTHGTSGIREFFIGSEAFNVVKNATCPVLTIPGNWQKTYFKKVLFPIRLVQGAIEKYAQARPIIEKNNSELLLLGLSEKNDLTNTTEINNLITKFKLQLYINHVQFKSEICQSNNFAQKIKETENIYDPDLIIITANLDVDIKSFFLGAFAQQVINHSRHPILSIKPIDIVSHEAEQLDSAKNWANTIDFANLGL